jgi:hypothetical protein
MCTALRSPKPFNNSVTELFIRKSLEQGRNDRPVRRLAVTLPTVREHLGGAES